MKEGERVDVLPHRGEADTWYSGTIEGEHVRLDGYPHGAALVAKAQIAPWQHELDAAAFYLWTITDGRTGERRKTSYRMQPADARARFPDATPHIASKEDRHHIGNAGGSAGRRHSAPK